MHSDPRAVLTVLFALLVILVAAFYANRSLPWREASRPVRILLYGNLVLALGIALSALLAVLLDATR